MKYLKTVSAAIFALASSVSVAEEIILDTPNSATTLPVKNRYASAFFTVNQGHFNVVVALSMGTGVNDQLIRQVIQLADGQSYQLSIGGYAGHEVTTRIEMSREKDFIVADIQSCEPGEDSVNCN